MNPRKTNPTRNGFVLVLVLGFVLAMSVWVMGLSRQTNLALRFSQTLVDQAQALANAQGGQALARSLIVQVGDPGSDRRTKRWLHKAQSVQLPDGTCRIHLQDEGGKLNINRLIHPDGRPNRVRIEQMLRLIDVVNRGPRSGRPLSYAIVPALVDWTYNDDETTTLDFVSRNNRGAEQDAYRGAASGLRCANRPLDQIEQLAFVHGVTPEAYDRLLPFLTVKGDGRVNLNSVRKEVLEALSEKLDAALANVIVNRRQHRPFTQLTELRDLPGISDEIYRDLVPTLHVGASGPYYRIETTGQLQDQQQTVTTLVKKNNQTQTVDVLMYRESFAKDREE